MFIDPFSSGEADAIMNVTPQEKIEAAKKAQQDIQNMIQYTLNLASKKQAAASNEAYFYQHPEDIGNKAVAKVAMSPALKSVHPEFYALAAPATVALASDIIPNVALPALEALWNPGNALLGTSLSAAVPYINAWTHAAGYAGAANNLYTQFTKDRSNNSIWDNTKDAALTALDLGFLTHGIGTEGRLIAQNAVEGAKNAYNEASHLYKNLKLGIAPYSGRYNNSYFVTDPVDASKVVKYTWDPIANTYVPSMPGKTLNNKMSVNEILSAPTAGTQESFMRSFGDSYLDYADPFFKKILPI